MGPVTQPVYVDNGQPWRSSDWPEALNGTASAFSGVNYAQLAAALAPYFDHPEVAGSTANETATRAVLVAYQVSALSFGCLTRTQLRVVFW